MPYSTHGIRFAVKKGKTESIVRDLIVANETDRKMEPPDSCVPGTWQRSRLFASQPMVPTQAGCLARSG